MIKKGGLSIWLTVALALCLLAALLLAGTALGEVYFKYFYTKTIC